MNIIKWDQSVNKIAELSDSYFIKEAYHIYHAKIWTITGLNWPIQLHSWSSSPDFLE